jgi:hypothetical protein
MPDVSGPGGSTSSAHPNLPATAGLDGFEYRTVAEAGLEHESAEASRIGWGFISLYTLAFISTSLLFLAPLLVTLALKVNSLVGIGQAPNSLAVVTGIAALLAMVANPFFGKTSDRTTSPLGMRRPWMVISLVGGYLGTSWWCWHPTSRWSSSDGALPSCSSTHCSPPWWRCSRQPARHVPGPVRHRRVLHPALRGQDEGSPACQGGQADLVAAGIRQHCHGRQRDRRYGEVRRRRVLILGWW